MILDVFYGVFVKLNILNNQKKITVYIKVYKGLYKGFTNDFGANKTPVEVIKEGAFEETYFRDIYSGVNDRSYKKS